MPNENQELVDAMIEGNERDASDIADQFDGFTANVEKFGEMASEDATTWNGYLAAHRARREYFKRFKH